ncbi:MAG: hypothetical protein EOM69_02240 [Clostridia bacterium]|nr:hypothetical protein [Clostridia bacterium]
MKKYLIPTAVFLVLMLASFGFALKMRSDDLRFVKELERHLASCDSMGKRAVGEVDGAAVYLAPENLRFIASAITRIERVRALKEPDVSGLAQARVRFPDGAEYAFYELQSETDTQEDICCIRYTDGKRTRTYTIEGYGTMKRVRACISLAGFAAGNTPAD